IAGTVYTPAPDVAERLGWTFEDGVARYTGIYRNARGTWISAFAPVGGEAGKRLAVLVVDYPVEIYLDRLNELQFSILYASMAGALAALIVGLVMARRLTRPISALTRGVARVAEGDPARVMEVLNGYLARMTDIVVEHGGTINEFIGDAIFAIFGAPIPHADHAERAAATALAMQRAMTEINDTHVARGLPRFEMGI